MAGRPPKYDKWLSEESLARIEKWAADNMPLMDMAKVMNINFATFCVWRNNFPEFNEAIKRGHEKRAENIESTLHDLALGYCTEETKILETEEVFDGSQWVEVKRKKRVTSRKIPPNPAVCIFEAKNRCGYADNPNQKQQEILDTALDNAKKLLSEVDSVI